jgi:1-acyl-sn-glycerol-3-phosphate acyltransferase
MIVSNHLSYLDILAYSALVPCVFVAKKEVASWPVLGVFARLAGSIFVDRTRRTKVAETNQCIATALQSGVVVLLFPEGTSSDGETVLPFRSSHLEPAIRSGATMRPAAIHYRMDGGSAAREACYWGDMTFLPHLLNLFTKRKTHACVAFGQEVVKAAGRGRKQNGLDLHKHVCTLTELLRP